MSTELNEIVSQILDHLAGAYAGHSQYPLSHLGTALQCHRSNGGLALIPVAELAAAAAHILARQWEWDAEQEATATAEIRQAMRQAGHDRRSIIPARIAAGCERQRNSRLLMRLWRPVGR